MVFELSNDDITMAAGGPMGSPIVNRWRKHFTSMARAKHAAEVDYGGRITWRRCGSSVQSPDLGDRQYTICKIALNV